MRTAAAGEVGVRREGAVLTVTLNRPERLNAVTADVLDDLGDLLEEAGEDDGLRVVVLTGAGRAFSSGADLGADLGPALGADLELGPGPGSGPAEAGRPRGVRSLLAANRVVRSLRSMPQPVVAAVNGPAVGVGCSLALGCDLVVAAESAYFLLSFTSIALMPDGGATALVPAAIGRARAMEMALVPERIPAAVAHDWGMIYRVVPDGELAATVTRLVDRLAAGAPRALAATKLAVNAAALDGLDAALQTELEGQSRLLATADFAEAAGAFGERRPPVFTGR
ncbi:MAG TPA: enoyl-CoA hydratase-related protein [Kineosporiaceae bacterium]|nr:enoyl-CoA hydratase-related protein [Kineosporiaceae bacterium]